MIKKPAISRIGSFIFEKLFKINDSPRKIALGVGLGVFSGFFPATGPAAALFLAFVFRANRAAALLGSIITNSWLSIVTFVFAVKVGSMLMGRPWQEVHRQARELIHNFQWNNFMKISFLELILPVVAGYLVIALFLGLLSYLVVLFAAEKRARG
ncbi:MAG: DUF2062 domain-containing protein [Candidatus Omnitrophica bacterium]|nr:DUF2062 domain-containing protein [Candidatus Omnitrophota bacterium]MDD5771211.1 DUF2062 domain-containing protein [Candidatus Omnitrophota bacterium]